MRFRWSHFLLSCLLSLASKVPARAGDDALDKTAVSPSGAHASIRIAHRDAKRLRDVIVQFDVPVRPASVTLTVGQHVFHDDGRESYQEVKEALPFAYVHDARGTTTRLHIQSDGRMTATAHQLTLEVSFYRAIAPPSSAEEPQQPEILTFLFPGDEVT